MALRSTRHRPAAAVALLLLAGIATPRRAAASDWMPEFGADDYLLLGGVAVLSCGILATDIAFTVHDAHVASAGVPLERGWAIAETAVGGLQTIGAVAVYATTAPQTSAYSEYGLGLLPATWVAGLGVHGVWGLGAPGTRPSLLIGGPYAVAADTLLSTWAIRGAIGGRLAGLSHAIVELALTAPQIPLAAYGAATAGSTGERDGLIALAGWSGALFLHGAASLIWRAAKPPVVEAQPASARYHFGPTMLQSQATGARTLGLQMGGVF